MESRVSVLKLEKMRDERYCEKQWSGILSPVHRTGTGQQTSQKNDLNWKTVKLAGCSSCPPPLIHVSLKVGWAQLLDLAGPSVLIFCQPEPSADLLKSDWGRLNAG